MRPDVQIASREAIVNYNILRAEYLLFVQNCQNGFIAAYIVPTTCLSCLYE